MDLDFTGINVFRYGTGKVKASLPDRKPYCQYCRWIRHNYGLDRAECVLTGEFLLEFKHSIGAECPIEWDGKEDDIEY